MGMKIFSLSVEDIDWRMRMAIMNTGVKSVEAAARICSANFFSQPQIQLLLANMLYVQLPGTLCHHT